MLYREAKVNLPKEFAESLNDFLETLQIPGYYEILFDSSIPKDEGIILPENTNIRAYLNSEDVTTEIKLRIFLSTLCPSSHSLEIREIETREYEEAYKEFYKPFAVDRVWIIPIWEKDNDLTKKIVSDGDIPLFLNPGVAFGTGHHETTQMIVERLQTLIQKGDRILDLGTGSGILSLLCGLLGASTIFSLDIDPNAVKAALSNWKENIYPNDCKFEAVESGFDHPDVFGRDYDIVLANITFAVLSQNISHIAKIQSPVFLFSGIITEKKDEFLELLAIHIPGKLVDSKEKNGWERIEWIRS
ncbi:50S ribosomal protein L11 methyltransferase [Leptospira sp. GIMC2001]|uniref:50S ribosomal protein L11 methyltransferase n=1 Tax=Leptospira sp. GIMC2001 TaxID=1513297 RepID=UPI00234A7876|nr:50S ribosomal protein L11 methyltransferase [Leptospira sp. GIMC2001]WCL48492.1 50S ribosomal protein L11 methyltransferase [Leptospira sp. GIMC2001]